MPSQHERHLENERTNPYPDPVEVIGEYDLNSPDTWITDPHPSTHPRDPGDQVISEPPNERALRMIEFDQNHTGAQTLTIGRITNAQGNCLHIDLR